jgi:diguanylate cyclase (GGDEF)-like protein
VQYQELINFLENVGKDPSRLVFEDELTGIHNRRFLLSYLEHKVRWKGEEDYPLSVLVIDLDRFKEVNDTHGHATGDQVLTWIAALLKEVAGEQGLPIRFGGDEFMILLPHTGKGEARAVADRLLQRTRDRPFQIRDAGIVVPITMSVGVASAPEDAQSSRGLFQAADTAVYHAKQSGRDQAAAAGEVDPKRVFPKTALHRLQVTGIAGRKDELAVVADTLQGLSEGHSQFIVFEGGAGIGKTMLLDTVRRNLTGDETFFVTKVSADQQEAYRPYYLVTRILVSLLNQREDKGTAILERLSEQEVAYLSRILPQLTEGHSEPPEDDEGVQVRQGIFSALARFLPRVVEFRPLVLIIDDLQYADEATLLLLRVLLERQDLTLFICSSALESLKLSGDVEPPPLERFLAAPHKDLTIRRAKLQPLGADDIAEHLNGVFPNLQMPDGFELDLARTSQGNPLFLGEIIRKLVTDRKVTLVGQEWVIEPLEEGYLPRSLEEIVTEKIAALDEEGRQLLERASTLGEDIPLSILTGSAELDENRVLEFLDRAEALGLVSLDFQINDEVMRFLGKRVLDISYGGIDEGRRTGLHEQIGNYQEGLYQQRLLPSASLLAYHFKRSANQDKARRYEKIQVAYTQSVFNADEAANYTGEILDEVDTGPRLAPESLPLLPNVLRTFMSAVRNIRLYPPDSKAIPRSLQQVREALDEILAKNDRLHLSQSQHALLANGQRVDITELKFLTNSFVELLNRFELKGIVFYPGGGEDELQALLTALARVKPETIEPEFWRKVAVEKGLEHVELLQMQYSRVRTSRTVMAARLPAAEDEQLDAEDLAELPNILRALHGATTNIKLYPVDSKPVGRAIENLHITLQGVLTRRPALTLARLDEALLVNGAKVDTERYETIATGFLTFVESVGLESITFFAGIALADLETFIGALRDLPSTGTDSEFWDSFAVERGLSSLAFNQRQYALGVVQSLLSSVGEPTDEEPGEGDATIALVDQLSEDPNQALREAVPRFGKELLIKGEYKLVRRLLRALFEKFSEQDPSSREQIVQTCGRLMESLILGLQHQFSEIAADFVLAALSDETEPRVMHELATLLYAMAGSAVQFADYQLAGRILMELKTRREQLAASPERDAQNLVNILIRDLDPVTQKLLETDVKADDPIRQERAAQVIGSLGVPGIPLLIEVIKQERDFRARQTAASLLAEMGRPAAKEIKRALVTEVIVEPRFRIMEVIDTVTGSLRDELEFSLGDGNPKIRRGAFQLFERLHQDDLIEVIIPLANGDDASMAKGAIRSLGILGSDAAVQALISILKTTKSEDFAIACCRALARLGNATAIDALARVLAQRKFLFLGRRWGEQVRAAAAIALKQISHPKATDTLSHYTSDSASRVRHLARPSGAMERPSAALLGEAEESL